MFGVVCFNFNILFGVMFINLMKILINFILFFVVFVFDLYFNMLIVILLNIVNIYFNLILFVVVLSF